jgi:hypothetical protein
MTGSFWPGPLLGRFRSHLSISLLVFGVLGSAGTVSLIFGANS